MFDSVAAGITPNVRNLCRCGVRIPSIPNRCPAFDKDKYLEPMFAMLVKPELKLGYAEMMIATTSSRSCKKHILLCTKVSKGTLLQIKKLQALQKTVHVQRPAAPVKTMLCKCRCCKTGMLVTIDVFGKRGPPLHYFAG